jgi:hypothetical protein
VEVLEDVSKSREEILEELKNLRTRLQELEEARQVIRNTGTLRRRSAGPRKERKNGPAPVKYRILRKWSTAIRRKNWGKRGSNFGMFPLSFSRPRKQKGNESLRKSMMALGSTG